MKKIFIIIITLFLAQPSLAIVAFDSMPAFDYVSLEITEVVRDSVNEANLLVSGIASGNNHQENEPNNISLILRDKLNLIKPLLEKGFMISFVAPFGSVGTADNISTYYADESNPSDITIMNNFNKRIAYTKNLSVLEKGQSIPVTIENTNMIISHGEIIDCMKGTNNKVCHPEINVQTVGDKDVLRKGDFLSSNILNTKKVYITDTHVYKQHARDEEDYFRVQLLIEPSDVQKTERHINNFYAKKTLFNNPYCDVNFSESGEVLRSCGVRGWLYNVKKYIALKMTPEPDYGMIAC